MIKIQDQIIKKQPKFWNHAVFHPTDAIEDPWGMRILDRMAADGAIKTLRIYAMLEDIVYLGENGELCYDFRLSDLRLDYLLEKNYDLVIAYAGMPDCIAKTTDQQVAMAKNKTRYKGKMWNSAPPKDHGLWEEICYQYTKHLVERYGEEQVSKWHCQCHNEPDRGFFMTDYSIDDYIPKSIEYAKLYEAFVRGVRRASKGIRVGGPVLAHDINFLDRFLGLISKSGAEINYIALHVYGTNPPTIKSGSKPLATENQFTYRIDPYMELIRKHGFGDTELIIDEWGAASGGFENIENCPGLIFRENEVFSSFFTKFIYQLIESGINISKMMICLSGQHEMVTDFTGFRNFFTLNFIPKPIYNAHLLTSKMGDLLVESQADNENVYAVSTKDETGRYTTMLTYCSKNFEEDLPEITEELSFAEDISKKTVTVWCIDKKNNNPYRMWERAGCPEMSEEMIRTLKQEGNLTPSGTQKGSEPLRLKLTPNCTYFVEVK